VIAYKLLRPGRVAMFGAITWPPPGEWLEVERVDPCRSGIHACRAADLPSWLALGELWEIELADIAVDEERKLIAHRGRLVRLVEGWNDEAAEGFTSACTARALELVQGSSELQPYADDSATGTLTPAIAGYITARIAELKDGPAGYDAERRRQAGWLVDTLGLSA
jgi:hypothetical protein